MKKLFHLLSLLLVWVMILPGGGLPKAAPPPIQIQVILETPPYFNTFDANGNAQVEIEGFHAAGGPGDPALPAKAYAIALPPDVDPASVTVEVVDVQRVDLEGSYTVAPAPPAEASRAGWELVEWGANSAAIQDGKNSLVYKQDAYFPQATVRLASTSQMRKWRFASLVYSPLQYNPRTGKLRLATQVEVRLRYSHQALDPALAEEALRDTVLDEQAADLFLNYAQASAWYAPEPLAAGAAPAWADGTADYVIITTSYVASNSTKLASFIAHKEARGFTVEVVTETQWGSMTGDYPNDNADKIRKWLQNNYLAKHIEYVLLVGDPDPPDPRVSSGDHVGDVIQKLAWPRRGESDPYVDSPTDYYYADLTGDWDLDGDGYYGEYDGDNGPGGVDFFPEVYVGRITLFNNDGSRVSKLDSILQKIMDYENAANIDWRKTALLPMTFQAAPTDGAHLAERMKADYLNGQGFTSYTMYQQTGANCSTSFTPNERLVDGAVRERWKNNDYGVVAWWAHGNPSGALVGYGNSGEPCREYGYLFHYSDTANLDNAHPAFNFQGACYGIDPTVADSPGYAVLKKGGIAVVSATALSFFEDGDWTPHPNLIDTATVGYYFTQHIVADGWNAGHSLYDMMAFLSTQGLEWGQESWMNLMTFNLLGDPSVGIGLNVPNAPTNLVASQVSTSQIDLTWDDNSSDETGFEIERSPDGATGWTEIATVGAGVESYSDTTLACSTRYYYRVRSSTTGGDSPYSNIANTTTVYCTCTPSPALAACGGIYSGNNGAAGSTATMNAYNCSLNNESGPEYIYTFTRNTSGKVTATLSGMSANLDIFVLNEPNGTCSPGSCVSGDTTIKFDGAANKTFYLAVDGRDGAVGNYTLSLTCEEPPPQPQNLVASPASISQINLTWTDTSNELGYRIQRSTDGGLNWGDFTTVSANSISYANTGLVDNTTYDYQVIAYNNSGSSPPSNVANATTLIEPPANLNATAAATTVNLTWTETTNNETGFKIERCQGSSCSSFIEITEAPANATNYADITAAIDAHYSYRIRAYDANGPRYSGYSNVDAAVTPPNPPSGLAATLDSTASHSEIDLTWVDASSTEVGFKIERSPNGSSGWTHIGTSSPNNTMYTNSGLADNTPYYYRVRAYNSGGDSIYSSTASATTLLAPPVNLAVADKKQTWIKLSWKDQSGSETGFKIEHSSNGMAPWTEVGTAPASSGSSGTVNYQVDGLTQDTTYHFRVRADAGAVYSTYSNAVFTTTLPDPPAAPTGLLVVTNDSKPQEQIDLSWIDYSLTETGFKIERCEGAGCSNFTQVDTVATNVTQYYDDNKTLKLKADTTYTYRVQATNMGGDSAYTNVASAKTRPYAANAPANLQAELANGAPPRIDLTWEDKSNNEDGFTVEQSLAGSGDWTPIATKAAGSTSHSVTFGLVDDREYAFRVKAFNEGGTSGFSNTASAATLPAAPTGLTAAAVSPLSIHLTWTDASQTETGFKIERCQGAGCTDFALIHTTGANAAAYDDSVPAPGTYVYRVYAYHAGGVSGASNPASTETPTGKPAAPSGLASEMVSITEVRLTWTDNSADETRFEVQRKVGSAGAWADLFASLAPNTAVRSDSSVSAGSTYVYRVRACNGFGCSEYSNETSTTVAPPLTAPMNLTGWLVTETQINLVWYSAGGEDGFILERFAGDLWHPDVEIRLGPNLDPAQPVSYQDKTAACGTHYYYRVSAYQGEQARSDYSNVFDATTAACVQGPQRFLFIPLINH